jgi:hypothetical protein
VPLLASESFGLGDCDALKSNLLQGLFNFIKLERLDDRLDLFHRFAAPLLDAKQRLAARFRPLSRRTVGQPKHALCQSSGREFCPLIQYTTVVSSILVAASKQRLPNS